MEQGRWLSDLVARTAQVRPSDVAATCDDVRLTWSELDHRVGTMAAALADSGIERGDRVGIYLHKSVESLVAVHAILRVGAAYVPIDPLAPAETMATIIGDCGIEVLISHEPRRAGLARLAATADFATLHTIIGLDPVNPADAGDPPDNGDTDAPTVQAPVVRSIDRDEVERFDPIDPVSVTADDLAYVMYTSGSTGAPKGIMHTHGSGMSYATMSAELYGLTPDDRMANIAPLHFDQSTFELLTGVAVGARVVLVPEPYLRFPASLAQYVADQGCTTLYTVPSLFQQLLARGGFADLDLSAIRWILPGGEVFPREPLTKFLDLLPQARFSNIYGPAEVNQCTYFHFDAPPEGDSLPIGYACPGAELLVVDDSDQPIDGPDQGELLVRASTMMAGYWNRPDLDAGAFVDLPGPDGGGEAQRWYRTGDFVSWADADGCLLYHGRRDNQIKIRGNRVELEMVETAVCSLDGVEQAVIGVRPEATGESTLIARYTADSSAEGIVVDQNQWRRQLAAQLPAYAIPSSYEVVDEFPLTPSGKVDRRSVRASIDAGAEVPAKSTTEA